MVITTRKKRRKEENIKVSFKYHFFFYVLWILSQFVETLTFKEVGPITKYGSIFILIFLFGIFISGGLVVILIQHYLMN